MTIAVDMGRKATKTNKQTLLGGQTSSLDHQNICWVLKIGQL